MELQIPMKKSTWDSSLCQEAGQGYQEMIWKSESIHLPKTVIQNFNGCSDIIL